MNNILTSNSKIYVAGHRGMVGSAIVRLLNKRGFTNIVTKTSSELDLRDQSKVKAFFIEEKPDFVFLAAAKVGGINANNKYKAQFLYDNLMIECNVIHSAHEVSVKKLLFLGSSCIYPKHAEQPISEESLLTGILEPTNEPYAIAKIAGLKLCESYRYEYNSDFISVMPTNLYGPNDNYDIENSHVLPALIRRFSEAKKQSKTSVTLWGDGSALREFLHVDDLAEACLFLISNYSDANHINIGSGEEVSIKNLAKTIKDLTGYTGEILWNTSMPNGTPKKELNMAKLLALGWRPRIGLIDGITETILNYQENQEKQ